MISKDYIMQDDNFYFYVIVSITLYSSSSWAWLLFVVIISAIIIMLLLNCFENDKNNYTKFSIMYDTHLCLITNYLNMNHLFYI